MFLIVMLRMNQLYILILLGMGLITRHLIRRGVTSGIRA